MMRKVVEQIKSFYERGVYTIAQINAMLEKGKITEAEYIYIVGENEK